MGLLAAVHWEAEQAWLPVGSQGAFAEVPALVLLMPAALHWVAVELIAMLVDMSQPQLSPSLTKCRKDLSDVRLRHGAHLCGVLDIEVAVSLLVEHRKLPSIFELLEGCKVEGSGAWRLMKLD